MSSDIALSVENLSKSYFLDRNPGHVDRYTSLRDTLATSVRKLGNKTVGIFTGRTVVKTPSVEEFSALTDVSFEIKRGDRVGVIGRNGAGKSTLLKILSRITEPTKGRITINGRVASLLEVGTGFHPELTGRENIFLNGAILGMSRREIQRKFDEIVDFAEVEKFLDTPVKRYSSGMYVRLAFSVAAHIETEILIVDEVLAVGDVAFQKKCMSKMDDVAQDGRALLFVSHNMGAVSQLCNSSIFLKRGRLVEHSDNVSDSIQSYMNDGYVDSGSAWINQNNSFQNEWFTPKRFYVGDEGGERLAETSPVNSDILVYIEGVCENYNPATQVGVALYDSVGGLICWSFTTDNNNNWVSVEKGTNKLKVVIPKFFLNEGVYRIELGVSLYQQLWICEPGRNAPQIQMEVSAGFVASPYWTQKRPGTLAPNLVWSNKVKNVLSR